VLVANRISYVVCLEIVAGIDVFKIGWLLVTKQRISKCNIEFFSVFVLYIIF